MCAYTACLRPPPWLERIVSKACLQLVFASSVPYTLSKLHAIPDSTHPLISHRPVQLSTTTIVGSSLKIPETANA